MKAIPPALAPPALKWEPPRTNHLQTQARLGAPANLPGFPFLRPPRTGLIFNGIGTTLGGFVPGSNPPDTNGRVGAKQYVQWNNTSFAVFNKTTGALLYGPGRWQYPFPIAGRRLRITQ